MGEGGAIKRNKNDGRQSFMPTRLACRVTRVPITLCNPETEGKCRLPGDQGADLSRMKHVSTCWSVYCREENKIVEFSHNRS